LPDATKRADTLTTFNEGFSSTMGTMHLVISSAESGAKGRTNLKPASVSIVSRQAPPSSSPLISVINESTCVVFSVNHVSKRVRPNAEMNLLQIRVFASARLCGRSAFQDAKKSAIRAFPSPLKSLRGRSAKGEEGASIQTAKRAYYD
jgi:hypothetical protein